MKQNLYIVILAMLMLSACCGPTTDSLLTDAGEIRSFPYRNGQYCIRQEKTTVADPKHEGLTVQEVYYINEGEPLTVYGYMTQRHTMRPHDTLLWTLQPSSTSARQDWAIPVREGFEQRNYLGMNNSDYGGGLPMIDLYEKQSGIAIGMVEGQWEGIEMPVQWLRGSKELSFAIRYTYSEPIKWQKGDTLRVVRTFEYKHEGDFFNALRTFARMMEERFGIAAGVSPDGAYEPVWCAWGYEREFTLDEVIGTLDKVAELGFKWVDVDDGYQRMTGDWEVNKRLGGSDKAMKQLTSEIHRRGMKAKLWWAPLAADPRSACAVEHPERVLLTDEWIPSYISWWNSLYLSPLSESTLIYTRALVRKFLSEWGFDGFKLDGQHLNLCPADYSPTSGVESGNEAQKRFPEFLKAVEEEAQRYQPESVVQLCPCGCAINYYLLPYMNQAVASDPLNSKQVRLKRKAIAALAPKMAYYGDHIELSDGGLDFASQIGVGAVIGTKFTYPKDHPGASGEFRLTEEKEAAIRHWMQIVKEKDLARGEYLNLYSWGYDYPEGHVIRQKGKLYYAFYADQYEGELELRGLEPGKTYTAIDYTDPEAKPFTVIGGDKINVQFNQHYLIELQ